MAALQERYPGLALAEQSARFWLKIPDRYRVGHEAHFAEEPFEERLVKALKPLQFGPIARIFSKADLYV